MRDKLGCSSVQLMLTLFVCGSGIIALQTFYSNSELSFLSVLLCLVIAFAVMYVLFLPSVVIKKRTSLDFISFATNKTPSAIIFVSAFYALYFVYTASYFLLKYTDMISQKINPNVELVTLTVLFLSACVYGAYKGTQAITRCGIFIFVLCLVTFALIFGGNVSNLNFENISFNFSGSTQDFISTLSYFATMAVVPVIFAFLCGNIKKFKSKHFLLLTIFLLVLAIIAEFFIFYVLAYFGKQQSFQMFTLSKTAQIGVVNGIDSFFLAWTTSSMFLIITAMLICINKSLGKSKNLALNIAFAIIILVMNICINQYNSIKEIILNPLVFSIFTIISAVILPCGYLVFGGKKKYD